MRKRNNGFVSFMRKCDGKTFLEPNVPLQVGDHVLVKSTDFSAQYLGIPVNFVGEVRQVYSIRPVSQGGEERSMYSLCRSNLGAWYLAEDLERVI